jgi:small subunit ribosomal protein S4
MARYTGPKDRITRRFGQYVVGSPNALEKRNFPPGAHGTKPKRGKPSKHSLGLAEKQKLRYTYGLLEKQFRRVFDIAKKEVGATGDRFQQLLETRLDSVIYSLGFASSRSQGRQLVSHGHVRVNGKKVNIPSYTLDVGDKIEVVGAEGPRSPSTLALNAKRPVPSWLAREEGSFKGAVTRLPEAGEMDKSINMQLIIEFYSR